jgi:Xaa-Pro aminopeptidase
MDYRSRQRRLADVMAQKKLGALLVTHMPNVRYLCGFTGSAGVLVLTSRARVFFTDGRYTEQATAEVQGARVVIAKNAPLGSAAAWIGRRSVQGMVLGVEGEHMSAATLARLRKRLPAGVRVREVSGAVERLRMVKDGDEIQLIRQAVLLGANLLDTAIAAIRPGVAEVEVAAELEYAARRAGVEAMSFSTIVAAGPRSALPHGRASAARIPERGFVILDFGVILAGYCSDMTRTVHVGRPSAEARQMYDAVRRAQQAAIEAAGPGVEVGEVDQAARGVLRQERLDRYFTHSTGHGVGLEIHEPPRLASTRPNQRERGATSREVLQPGMVVTIEPGIYIQGKGGVRIEDMVVVTDSGCDVLTPATKELITI